LINCRSSADGKGARVGVEDDPVHFYLTRR
jgi:hypothetical protein